MGRYTVLKGVKGAHNVTRAEFDNLEEAEKNARRWSESNSQGSYYALVRDFETAAIVKRFNCGTTVVAREVR